MWSIANEPASNEKGAKAYFEPFVELAKRKDAETTCYNRYHFNGTT